MKKRIILKACGRALPTVQDFENWRAEGKLEGKLYLSFKVGKKRKLKRLVVKSYQVAHCEACYDHHTTITGRLGAETFCVSNDPKVTWFDELFLNYEVC